jgi:hypothetical protein
MFWARRDVRQTLWDDHGSNASGDPIRALDVPARNVVFCGGRSAPPAYVPFG